MERLLIILFFCYCFLAATPFKPGSFINHFNEHHIEDVRKSADFYFPHDTTPSNHNVNCNCEQAKIQSYNTSNLSFLNSDKARANSEDLFGVWSHASRSDSVKAISFSEFDTIPQKFAVFKNVESVLIHNTIGIHGLDIFPKLKTIGFYASEINLDTDEEWLNRIEILYAGKTRFHGLESFQDVSNLKILRLEYSGFEIFPKDLETLKCLQKLSLGSYLFGEIDLNSIDLSNNVCLKEVSFHTWYNTLSGMPSGLSKSNIEKLEINHQRLTESEKIQVERIQKELETRN